MKAFLIFAIFFSLWAGHCLAQDIPWERGTDSVLVVTKRLLDKDPANSYVRLQRANALVIVGRKSDAHNELLSAVEFLKESKINLNQAYVLGNTLRFDFKDYKASNETADYILSQNPDYEDGLALKAYSLYRLELFDSAVKVYEKLIEKALINNRAARVIAGYYFDLGLACEDKRDFAKAVQAYTNAIQRGGVDDIVYKYRGKDKTELRDYRGALTDFDIYLSKSTQKDDVYYSTLNNKIYAKIMLKRYAEVIADATVVINDGKENYIKSYAYYLRGGAKNELKNTAGACLDWSKAGELGEEGVYDLIKKYCN